MPLNFCHPNTPHKKLGIPEWFVSSLMMDRALDAVIRRAKRIDRKHDIPYLAGYSQDGKTIYIDRHMPKAMTYAGREIDTDRYLILHEEVEKTLIDQLDLHYLHAHQIATRAEQAAVRAAGIRWHDYDRFMQKYVKRIGDERLSKVPVEIPNRNRTAASFTELCTSAFWGECMKGGSCGNRTRRVRSAKQSKGGLEMRDPSSQSEPFGFCVGHVKSPRRRGASYETPWGRGCNKVTA